jgi:hypothetical protein
MSKEVEKRTCPECESNYKLLYDLETTSGFPRFCPFCSAESYDTDRLLYDDEDNE